MSGFVDNSLGASVTHSVSGDGELKFVFCGRLDYRSAGKLWREVMGAISSSGVKSVVVEAGEVEYCDGSGLGLLFEIRLYGKQNDLGVEIRGLASEFAGLLGMFDTEKFRERYVRRKRINIPVEIGEATVKVGTDIRNQLAFVGELFAAFLRSALHPLQIRWKTVFITVEQVGANAVGIVAVIGFLFGLIIAFSSAMPMKQYGAEIYVADLVAMGLVRVLGPFITAILIAGRTGSAFAAEIGTMKINEEIDALEMMSFDPMHYLVVPRVLATTVMTPLLAVLASAAGLVGSAVVVLSLGYPLVTYIDHVRSSIDVVDFLSGLFKALVFGCLIASVGCFRGLETKSGSSAVGISTTQAVVSSIIMVVIAEGMFSVLFYYLGI